MKQTEKKRTTGKGWMAGARACYFTVVLASGAAAQSPPPTAPPSTAPAPDRTTASFGDWVLQCHRRGEGSAAVRVCELGQTYQRPGEPGPQAQVALGRAAPGEPLLLTVLVPSNVAIQPPPKVTLEGPNAQAFDLAWIRCLPSGCYANAVVSDQVLKKLNLQKDNGRLNYRDGLERDTAVPISFRGFSEALDAFHREGAK